MIYLKKAELEDRRKAYNWLYFSDFSSFLNELQVDDSEGIPTMQEFEEDYGDFFFQDSHPEKGRAYLIILKEAGDLEEIGFITYTAFHLKEGIAEIDIWLKSLEFAGKGYGTEAVKILTREVFQKKGFDTIIIRPCAKNVRAVKSYKKAGFKENNFKPEYYIKEFIHQLGPGNCKNGQDIFMVLKKKFYNIKND